MMPDVAASTFREGAALPMPPASGVRRPAKTLCASDSSCMASWRSIVPKKMKPALLVHRCISEMCASVVDCICASVMYTSVKAKRGQPALWHQRRPPGRSRMCYLKMWYSTGSPGCCSCAALTCCRKL